MYTHLSSPLTTPTNQAILLLRQTRRRPRHPSPPLHRLPPAHALRPQPKQPINHRRSTQRTALAIDQFGFRPRGDGDGAAERRGLRDDAGAGWRRGAGGYGCCCVWEGGGEGAADLLGGSVSLGSEVLCGWEGRVREGTYNVALWAGSFCGECAAGAVCVGGFCVVGRGDAAFGFLGEGVCAGCVGRVAVGRHGYAGEKPD
jgi:hypothetical protein